MDHVALSGAGIAADGPRLEAVGFRQVFAEGHVDNSVAKRALLTSYQPTMEFGVYCAPGGDTAIELTAHGSVDHACRSPVRLIIAGTPTWFEPANGSSSLGELGWLGPVPVVHAGGKGPLECRGVALPVFSIEREASFLREVLGFEQRPTECVGTAELVIEGPIVPWRCRLVLIEDTSAPRFTYQLDAAGLSCLAFLTRDIHSAVRCAVDGGATNITDVFPARANGREIQIAMFRTPAGHLCELLQFRAAKSRG
jgi:hypothetical protein